MPLCQPSATQLQLHKLYPQKGILHPRKISRDSQSHYTSCSCPHTFHHLTLVVVALTARKHALISLPPLPGMKGETLLNHMVGIRQQSYHVKQKEHKVSNAVHIRSPTKKHQKDFMHMDYQQVLEGNIMKDVGDGVKLKQAARARIENLGRVKSHSCFVNDPEHLNNTNQRTRLALSVGMVDEIQKLEIKNKTEGDKEGLYPVLQAAIEMYKRGETSKRDFTIKHTKEIFLLAFDVTPKSGKKAELADPVEEVR